MPQRESLMSSSSTHGRPEAEMRKEKEGEIKALENLSCFMLWSHPVGKIRLERQQFGSDPTCELA